MPYRRRPPSEFSGLRLLRARPIGRLEGSRSRGTGRQPSKDDLRFCASDPNPPGSWHIVLNQETVQPSKDDLRFCASDPNPPGSWHIVLNQETVVIRAVIASNCSRRCRAKSAGKDSARTRPRGQADLGSPALWDRHNV